MIFHTRPLADSHEPRADGSQLTLANVRGCEVFFHSPYDGTPYPILYLVPLPLPRMVMVFFFASDCSSMAVLERLKGTAARISLIGLGIFRLSA